MSVTNFCFQNADTKERSLDYVLSLAIVFSALINVTQQNLFETFVIFFQRHILASQIKIVEFL